MELVIKKNYAKMSAHLISNIYNKLQLFITQSLSNTSEVV